MSTPSSLGGGPSRLKGINESTTLKRHSAFEEIEDEEEHEHYHHQQQHNKSNRNGSSAGRWKEEALSGYSSRDDERRKHERQQQRKLVIKKQADANWMEERKKRLGLEKYRKELGSLSGGFGGGGKRDNDIANERVGDEEQRIGLEIRHRLENVDDEDKMQTDNEEQSNVLMESQPVKAEGQDEDTQARQALLSAGGNQKAQHEHIIINPITEEEALQRDMDSRPDAPSLSDYANMPVDDFGAALLRGMGWKEGMGAGKQRQGPINAPEIKKRAALLGLGAKERETIPSGSSNRSSSSSSRKPERRYVPVTRKERDEERGKEKSHSRSDNDRKRSYSPPTSSRSSRYDEDRERSRRDRDRYSDSRRSDRDYDRRRESERRDDRSRRDDRRDRHRSER